MHGISIGQCMVFQLVSTGYFNWSVQGISTGQCMVFQLVSAWPSLRITGIRTFYTKNLAHKQGSAELAYRGQIISWLLTCHCSSDESWVYIHMFWHNSHGWLIIVTCWLIVRESWSLTNFKFERIEAKSSRTGKKYPWSFVHYLVRCRNWTYDLDLGSGLSKNLKARWRSRDKGYELTRAHASL